MLSNYLKVFKKVLKKTLFFHEISFAWKITYNTIALICGSIVGSENLQCDAGGRCQCKPGVAGDKCDRCENNYFDFGQAGCR